MSAEAQTKPSESPSPENSDDRFRLTPEEKERVLQGAARDIQAAAAFRPKREPATPEEFELSRMD